MNRPGANIRESPQHSQKDSPHQIDNTASPGTGSPELQKWKPPKGLWCAETKMHFFHHKVSFTLVMGYVKYTVSGFKSIHLPFSRNEVLRQPLLFKLSHENHKNMNYTSPLTFFKSPTKYYKQPVIVSLAFNISVSLHTNAPVKLAGPPQHQLKQTLQINLMHCSDRNLKQYVLSK